MATTDAPARRSTVWHGAAALRPGTGDLVLDIAIHASFFTGRWPHELSAGWLTPLDATYPTLAEFLSCAATRRRDSSPTSSIAGPTRGWDVVSRAIVITSFLGSAPSSSRRWSTGRWRGSARFISS